MRARIIKIGNSQGVRIPKPLLEESGLNDEVEIVVEEDRLVISPVQDVRSGWIKAFQEMASRGDDALLDGDQDLPTVWEEEEWDWT